MFRIVVGQRSRHETSLDRVSIANQLPCVILTKLQTPFKDRLLRICTSGLQRQGKTAVCASIDGTLKAIFGIADAVRPESKQVRHRVAAM